MRGLPDNILLGESASGRVKAGENEALKRYFDGFVGLVATRLPSAFAQLAMPHEDTISLRSMEAMIP